MSGGSPPGGAALQALTGKLGNVPVTVAGQSGVPAPAWATSPVGHEDTGSSTPGSTNGVIQGGAGGTGGAAPGPGLAGPALSTVSQEASSTGGQEMGLAPSTATPAQVAAGHAADPAGASAPGLQLSTLSSQHAASAAPATGRSAWAVDNPPSGDSATAAAAGRARESAPLGAEPSASAAGTAVPITGPTPPGHGGTASLDQAGTARQDQAGTGRRTRPGRAGKTSRQWPKATTGRAPAGRARGRPGPRRRTGRPRARLSSSSKVVRPP